MFDEADSAVRVHKGILELNTTTAKLAEIVKLKSLLRRTIGHHVGQTLFRVSRGSNNSVAIHGHTMVIGTKTHHPPIAMAMGTYEEETTRLFVKIIEPGMTVVDIGAHVGYYTLLAAQNTGPSGKVYAFEPESNNFALLEKNVELNNYGNIHTENKAISNSTGPRELFITNLDSGRHSMYKHEISQTNGLSIDTVTLDDFLEQISCSHVDLIKIDVEGAELEVLQGMRRLINNANKMALILEFNPQLLINAGVDPFRFPQSLADYGFKIKWIDEKNGVLNLGGMDLETNINKLIKAQSSVNLYCYK